MSASDRLRPKEIKAWCDTKIKQYVYRNGYGEYEHVEIIKLMYAAYKRGYQDALSG